ncbi:MAG: carbamoyl-phosphate synthase large subunit [Deferribacteraceae bacterium]|nr:carbamoyl-phosphate synthase large subunit [Deferribacteraceae bacterium]
MPKREDIKKILIIGSGPIVIGQACEFDYSGTQACKALKESGYKIVLVNSNPATIMTDPDMADSTYIEPLNIKRLEEIISRELPDALLPNLGGQTGLNLTIGLHKAGILKKYNVEVIGITLDAIEKGEDRIIFKETMKSAGVETARSVPAYTIDEAEKIAAEMGYPVVIRPAYTLGGTGGGIVYNSEELRAVVARGLSFSMIHQVLVEECVIGWEELELEIVRDAKDQIVTVCFIENIDPMGVHTGDSICVAPMLTIDKPTQERLQIHAYNIARAVGVIGGANVQFAHDPKTGRIVIIEINPRTSRSSALASKATGFPIAYVSAKLAVGYTLDELPYYKCGSLDKYTPSGGHIALKFARWAFEKFKGEKDILGTQMKAVGEVLSIGNTFKESFMKAIRSLENGRFGLGIALYRQKTKEELSALLWNPSSERMWIIYEAMRKGLTVKEIHKLTLIKEWFLEEIWQIMELEEILSRYSISNLPDELLLKAKQYGFADKYLGDLLKVSESAIRMKREKKSYLPVYGFVPVSGTNPDKNGSVPEYYYSSYNKGSAVWGAHKRTKEVVMVLGGGPNRIGQGIEFDYCCVHASVAMHNAGYETVMINCNPETVSTDYDTSDRLYFEPLTVEDVYEVYRRENPIGAIVQFGGQTPLNIAHKLEEAGLNILGTKPSVIATAEDRDLFKRMMEYLNIKMPESGMAFAESEALSVAGDIGYPVMVRPSYVLGGRGMQIVYDDDGLRKYISEATDLTPERPALIDKFLSHALECEADALCDGKDVFIPTIMEHIEEAGVHSGDSAAIIPPVLITEKQQAEIYDYMRRIALELNVTGLINVQFAISGDIIYVLEANPRASRTIPLVSKVCGIQIAKIATLLMAGKSLSDFNLKTVKPPFYAVKEAVLPFDKFTDTDPLLGPEMKSTGEVMGIAPTLELAVFKAVEAVGQPLPTSGKVLISLDKKDSVALKIANGYVEAGFEIYATSGTHKFLKENGVNTNFVYKEGEGRPNISDLLINNKLSLIVNTPGGKKSKIDGITLRMTAIRYNIPYVTTLSGALAGINGIIAAKKGGTGPKSLQEYQKMLK